MLQILMLVSCFIHLCTGIPLLYHRRFSRLLVPFVLLTVVLPSIFLGTLLLSDCSSGNTNIMTVLLFVWKHFLKENAVFALALVREVQRVSRHNRQQNGGNSAIDRVSTVKMTSKTVNQDVRTQSPEPDHENNQQTSTESNQ